MIEMEIGCQVDAEAGIFSDRINIVTILSGSFMAIEKLIIDLDDACGSK